MIRCQNSIVSVNVRSVHRQFQHKPSVALRSLTALSIGPCGRLSQITWSASLSSAIVFGFVLSLWSASNIAPHTWQSRGFRSGEFGGQWSFARKSRQLARSQFCALHTVCAGAPSCWKMNPVGSNDCSRRQDLEAGGQRNTRNQLQLSLRQNTVCQNVTVTSSAITWYLFFKIR